jgi:phage terminase large subunit-like protein
LAALFALPMDEAELDLYRHHTGRTAPPSAPFKEACFVVGRRGGKSRVLSLVAVYLATLTDYAPYLAPGEVATIAVIAADRKQARSIFRFTICAPCQLQG